MFHIEIHHHHDPRLEQRLFEMLNKIQNSQGKIMTAISDYAAKVNASYAALNTALDDIKTEIQSLNDKITALQNSPGPISPEDQATLDAAQAQAAALVTKAQSLDSLTPPVPPAS